MTARLSRTETCRNIVAGGVFGGSAVLPDVVVDPKGSIFFFGRRPLGET